MHASRRGVKSHNRVSAQHSHTNCTTTPYNSNNRTPAASTAWPANHAPLLNPLPALFLTPVGVAASGPLVLAPGLLPSLLLAAVPCCCAPTG